MVEEFGKLMRDINAQEEANRRFKKLMLKKTREPRGVPKPRLPTGKITPSIITQKQLYRGTKKQTQKSTAAHARELKRMYP